jgi:hypothetical protein
VRHEVDAMRVKLVQRQRGHEWIAAVVSERSSVVLYACIGPDAGGVLLASIAWCREQRYTIVTSDAPARRTSKRNAA